MTSKTKDSDLTMKALAEAPLSRKTITEGIIEGLPFASMHIICLLVIWTGCTTKDVIVGVSLFFIRMWGITAGYHRYFSHKSFETSRFFQFILAFIGGSAVQQGVLWWTNHHRHHHQYSEQMADVHSPVQHSFFYAHTGWIFSPVGLDRKNLLVKDWKKFPELVWLDNNRYLPGFILAICTYLYGGLSCLIVGFFWSTILLQHATTAVNSFGHLYGKQRFITGDNSRNNWMVALLSCGEGWHNNHHYYPRSVRHGFKWWEIDVTFYVLKLLETLKIVWNLHIPPQEILDAGGNHPPLPFGVKDRIYQLLSDEQHIDIEQVQKDLSSLVERLNYLAQTQAENLGHNVKEMMQKIANVRIGLEQIKRKIPSLSFPRLRIVLTHRIKHLLKHLENITMILSKNPEKTMDNSILDQYILVLKKGILPGETITKSIDSGTKLH